MVETGGSRFLNESLTNFQNIRVGGGGRTSDEDEDFHIVPDSPATTGAKSIGCGSINNGSASSGADGGDRGAPQNVTFTVMTNNNESRGGREENGTAGNSNLTAPTATSLSAFPAFVDHGRIQQVDRRMESRDNIIIQSNVSDARNSSSITSTMAAIATLSGSSTSSPLFSHRGNDDIRNGSRTLNHRQRPIIESNPFWSSSLTLSPSSSTSASSPSSTVAAHLNRQSERGASHFFDNRRSIVTPAPPVPPPPGPPAPPAPPTEPRTVVSLSIGQVMDIEPPSPPTRPTVLRLESSHLTAREEAALILSSMGKVPSVNEIKKTVSSSSSSSIKKFFRDPSGIKLPMSSVAEFEDLEKRIDDSDELKMKLLNRLGTIGGKNPSQCVRNGLKTLMTDSLAIHFNWAGRGGKISFQSYEIKSVLFDAVRIAFPKVTDFQLKDPVQCWLKRSRHIQETEDFKLSKVSKFHRSDMV